MRGGKFNVLMDSAWGSSGKGKVASFLAKRYRVTDASTCNMPNAGHTVQVGDERTVYKVLPAASHFGAFSWLGPGSVIDPQRLKEEVNFGKTGPVQVHERAGVLRPEHSAYERNALHSIASTMQGSGACLAEKIMRAGPLWGVTEGGPNECGKTWGYPSHEFRQEYRMAVQEGMMLHEVAQGWGLSLDHGSHYPQCTSRNCGVGRALDDMAVPAGLLGDVYLVVRSYPIRVGNTSTGSSGGWMADQKETSWENIERQTGLIGLAQKELTTVTKRVRRVATFSWSLLQDAVQSNGATRIVFTFPEYLDQAAFKVREWNWLPQIVKDFVLAMEQKTGVPVWGISTGPEVDDMVIR